MQPNNVENALTDDKGLAVFCRRKVEGDSEETTLSVNVSSAGYSSAELNIQSVSLGVCLCVY